MKCRRILSITTIMLILGLFPAGCSSRSFNGTADADDNETGTNKSFDENTGIINATDYGAKNFIEPIECQLDGTNIIIAKNDIGNLSIGDHVKIINGVEAGRPGKDLTAKIKAIDGNTIKLDRKCGSTIITKVYIDSTKAFKTAFNYANVKNYDVVIPEGNYYVDSDIPIQTNVKCKGKIYTSNKGETPLFIISRKGNPVKISGSDITGNIEAGNRNIPELEQYALYDVIFHSQEHIMWRNNNPDEFYTKNETNRINSDGSLLVELVESYNDKSLLTICLYRKENPIRLEGLNIMCIDDAITDEGKSIIAVRRSDVTIEGLILDNENLSKKDGQRSGIGISDAVNVVLNDCKINGFMLDGLGYGIVAINTLDVTLNNTEISKTRHAVTGRHDNYTTVNGGTYEAYGGTLDSHWGYNYTVNNATISGYRAFAYDGDSFTVNNCNITTYYPVFINRRMDCPTIKRNVEIKNTTITYTGTSSFIFYNAKLTDFKHDAEEIYNPSLIIENVNLVLESDIPAVEIYTVNSDLNAEYIMQKLPDNIRVKDLYITGKDNAKLKNACFKMIAATNMYYTGNPEVYLENIKINKDIESGSLNYDGEIVYSFHPGHSEAQVPDTHYKMEVKDCGTLSIRIIPTILGDMLIENCNIIEYKHEGDLINEWPDNPVWWYKGTGKTIFRNVKFDRTGLPASSISIMNDAEFENCEFTNYGTIDYMHFGEQLPKVKILKMQDCIFNKGGITGGSFDHK